MDASMFAKMLAVVLAGACGAAEVRLTANAPTRKFADDPRNDLRAGTELRARVRFDADPAKEGEMTIAQKGAPNLRGSYLLRVDGPDEGSKFSFFVNVDGRPEPRVSIPIKPTPGAWHDIAAGWDGTNAWIAVDGRTARKMRRAESGSDDSGDAFPLAAELTMGPMKGVVRDFELTAPKRPLPDDMTIRAGFSIACDVTFTKQPKGETYLLNKFNEYLLRYDEKDGKGAFNFFVSLDGRWEPRASVPAAIELGRTYRLCGSWSGTESVLYVDGVACEPVKRSGRRRTSSAKLVQGAEGVATVCDVSIRNEKKPMLRFGQFRTRELMPVLGAPAVLTVPLRNIGTGVGACALTATGRDGVVATPARIELDGIAEGAEIPLEWRIDAGTNGLAVIDFEVTPRGAKKAICREWKRVVFMPKEEPKLRAREWSPEIRATRTFYVDADEGLDGNDGM